MDATPVGVHIHQKGLKSEQMHQDLIIISCKLYFYFLIILCLDLSYSGCGIQTSLQPVIS